MRILLADDEPRDLLTMEKQLGIFDEISIVGKVNQLSKLREAVQDCRPEVVFLDIRFPGRSGLDLVDTIHRNGSEVVLVTAYEEFALEAFRLRVWDYLLKPVRSQRLGETLNTLRDRLTRRSYPGTPEINLPMDGIWRRIPVNRITGLHTEGNHTHFHLESGHTLTSRMPLYRVLERFPEGHDFFRINRQTVVPLSRIRALLQKDKGRLRMQMEDGRVLVCSKRRSPSIRKKLEETFGLDEAVDPPRPL